MLDTVTTLILFIAFAADCTLLSLHYIHMLQLNSYRNRRYMRWIKENRGAIADKMGWLLLSMIAVACFLLQKSGWKERIACALLLLIHGYLNKPKRAKKPLVFTHRVMRLLLTHALLLITVYAAVYFTGMVRLGLGFLFLWAALTPLVTLPPTLLTMIESLLLKDINDARRILASMSRLM